MALDRTADAVLWRAAGVAFLKDSAALERVAAVFAESSLDLIYVARVRAEWYPRAKKKIFVTVFRWKT